MRRIFTSLGIICFLLSTLFADDNDALKLEVVRAVTFSNATMLLVGIKNHAETPVRAFRATLSRLNDFDESSQVCEIEFSSDSEFRTSRGPTNRHVIQTGETIFYSLIAKNDGTVETTFTGEDISKFPTAKGRYKLQLAKVISAPAAEALPPPPPERTAPSSTSPPLPPEHAATPPEPSVPRTLPSEPLQPTTEPLLRNPSPSSSDSAQTCIVVGVAPGDYLNIRSAPAMNSRPVFKLANGDEVLIRGASIYNGDTEWIPITSGSQQGWVCNKYLRANPK
jgi:hypothetical protein